MQTRRVLHGAGRIETSAPVCGVSALQPAANRAAARAPSPSNATSCSVSADEQPHDEAEQDEQPEEPAEPLGLGTWGEGGKTLTAGEAPFSSVAIDRSCRPPRRVGR